MNIQEVFFSIFAGLAFVSALMVILKKNPVSNAFYLVLCFFWFAGMYASLEAHFVAALQLILYAGAVMVLFVFVIMLLNQDQESENFKSMKLSVLVLSPLVAIGFALGWIGLSFGELQSVGSGGGWNSESLEAAGGNTKVLATALFNDYLIPFEVTSLLLLTAIVGAVAIARKERK